MYSPFSIGDLIIVGMDFHPYCYNTIYITDIITTMVVTTTTIKECSLYPRTGGYNSIYSGKGILIREAQAQNRWF